MTAAHTPEARHVPRPKFSPTAADKIRINAVAEAIALERYYESPSRPLIFPQTRQLVQLAAVEVGADPLPARQERQQAPSSEGAAKDTHGLAYIRLMREVLREVAAGRGGQVKAQQLAQRAMQHDQQMRAGYEAPGARRRLDGEAYEFKFQGARLVFEVS